MDTSAISLNMRLSAKAESKVRAYADVTIALGEAGTITICGVSVLHSEGRPARVMAPARKGNQTWFNTVELAGKIRFLVETAVLAEYERKTSSSEELTGSPKSTESSSGRGRSMRATS